jgi:hypothetical protein
MVSRFGGVGIALPLNQTGTNALALPAGGSFLVPPGSFNLKHGLASSVQTLDPVLNVWRPAGSEAQQWQQVDSDGGNYRVANTTGCPLAALLTNAGTGYTSAPVVAATAGASKWVAVMGQVISTTMTVVQGGANYVYPPIVIIQAPPPGGIQATATSVLTAGAVSSLVVTNQGGGYLTAPFVTILNDPRDITGGGAVVTTTLTGAQTVNGVICIDHGNPVTALPSLTFTGGGGTGAVAVPLMNWAVLTYAVTSGGTGFTGAVIINTLGNGVPTTATAYVNPDTQANFIRFRPATIQGAASAGVIVAAGQILIDPGSIGGIASNIQIVATGSILTAAPTLTITVGGVTDFLWMQMG